MNPGFVVTMGIVTVFFGLIVLIILCNLMGRLCRVLEKVEQKMEPAQAAAPVSAPVAAAAPADGGIANRQEFIAAVSAVIAEEMGTDVSAIRILSVKKV